MEKLSSNFQKIVKAVALVTAFLLCTIFDEVIKFAPTLAQYPQ
jgi:hypothetical protein